MRLSQYSTALLATVSAVALLPGVSHAQTASSADTGVVGLEEVVVTAERRSENLQRTAASVSVRTGEELLTQGKYNLSHILDDVPGVKVNSGVTEGGLGGSPASTDSPASGLTIRGIPSNVGTGGAITSVATSAAIYVDDVYNGIGGGYDIDRVELLRGPQGTLYGRSATTGVVAITTANPDLTAQDAAASAEVGNFSLRRVTGAVNVPLINDKLAVRLSGNSYTRDGYYHAEGGALSNFNLRAKLLFRPTDNFSLLLGAASEDNEIRSGGISYTEVSPGNIVGADTPIGLGENSSRQYWGVANWQINDALNLTYISAYRSWESDATLFLRIPGIINGNQRLKTPKDDFWTQEVRLSSAKDGKLTWQVGAQYYLNDLENSAVSFQAASGALTNSTAIAKKTTAMGGFGEATYAFSDTWRFTGGLRYDHTEVQTSQTYTSNLTVANAPLFSNIMSPTYGLPENNVTRTLSGPAGERTFNNVTYKLRLEHDLTPSNMVYALTSTGFTPGDISLTTNVQGLPTTVVFDAETLTSYEIGSKNRFLDNKLQVNLGAFYYEYGGYQIANINISPNPLVTAFTTFSAPARAMGFEAEMIYRFTPDDTVTLNLGHTQAEFTDRSGVIAGTGGRTFGDYYSLSEIPNVVPFTANASYSHVFHLTGGSTLQFRGQANYLSRYTSNAITTAQLAAGALAYVRTESQVLGSLDLTWTSPNGKFNVSGYVRNVDDNRYKTRTLPQSTQTGGVVGTPYLSDPRTFGIVLSAKM